MHLFDRDKIADLQGYRSLEALALDLHLSWNHKTSVIWRQLDEKLWDLTHNPLAVLQTASSKKISDLLADKKISDLINDLIKVKEGSLNSPSWFQQYHCKSPLSCVAYFSMEFMLSEALPIYSGGLGNVAGDQLKAAHDLGVPVIAIGLLYSQGYFRQFIDNNGNQRELYPYNDPGQLPIRPLRSSRGEWLRFSIELPGSTLWVRAWEAQVGKRKLYLLDSNDPANAPMNRSITSDLYGGDKELRLKQEIILGICGWRLLDLLELQPEVCHMNEGHAAFAILERAFCFMKKTKQPFDVAMAATRIGNVFTTHTAVTAGFDLFSPTLIMRYLQNYVETNLGVSIEKILALGQLHPYDDFNMAYLALRGCGAVNAVSKLHGVVSQQLFKNAFPRFPEEEVPIGYVTNGVHVPTWDSVAADELWTESCGKTRWLEKTNVLTAKIEAIPATKIWEMRNKSRARLIDQTRVRLFNQLQVRGASAHELEKSKSFLDPNTLTLGFARRFATYKRADLLLSDEDRFVRILTNKNHPVQLIIAGKAHPADSPGHALIKKWMDFISKPEVRPYVIFLTDYDMVLTAQLVQGVDLWINTPRRPWEACGTSGMKVLANGGLNLSELDGWWAEAYTPEVGFAIGDRKEHGEDPNWDRAEANALYDLLEKEVIPEFYTRDAKNIPTAWTKKIQMSMAQLTGQFSSNRSVREYTEKLYLPAAEGFRNRTSNNSELAKQIAAWQASLEKSWSKIGFGEVKIQSRKDHNQFEVQVYLNELNRNDIKVELYSISLKKEMEYQGPIPNNRGGHIYRLNIPTTHSISDFTVRILPYHTGATIPLEAPQILWER